MRMLSRRELKTGMYPTAEADLLGDMMRRIKHHDHLLQADPTQAAPYWAGVLETYQSNAGYSLQEVMGLVWAADILIEEEAFIEFAEKELAYA